MTLNEYLLTKGFNELFEGCVQDIEQQIKEIIELTKTPNINVMEIGFNAGNSADIMLKNNDTLKLTSFDIGEHEYLIHGKEYINMQYGNRHTLILGNSLITVPAYTKENPDTKFDVIFIDGGHQYDVAKEDINNCFHLAHKDTIVIVDDTIYTKDLVMDWTIGVTKAWEESIAENKIVEKYRVEYSEGRGMSWGYYNKE